MVSRGACRRQEPGYGEGMTLRTTLPLLALFACQHTRPHCFPGEVLIATPRGPTPIAAVGTGDTVWAVDLEEGALVEATVAFRWDTFGDALVTVRAADASVRTTPTHRFRDATTQRWVRAQDLTADHALMVADRELVVSAPVEISPPSPATPPVEVHSLKLDGPHRAFVAGDFVVAP